MILFDGRGVLLDVEGTTSSLAFVEEVLFPFARRHVGAFLERHAHDPAIHALLGPIRAEAGDPAPPDAAPDAARGTAAALVLMGRDAKFGPLKDLQGRIWRSGFESGELVAHVFDDVPAALSTWADSGLDVRIYSSGSIEAQRLFFGHTAAGDLLPWLRGHYDTTTGPKREAASYEAIAADMGLEPRQVLFVSDVGAELDAARRAGMQTALADRPGNRPSEAAFDHPVVATFADIVT